jgi:hypothetical protein
MNRRNFLSSGAILALCIPAALVSSRCGGATEPEDPNAQRTFTSTSDDGHTHTITIQRSEVQNPPASGITRQTSTSTAHTHQFSMTQAELMTVNGGGSVNVTTSVTNVHDHSFTITKWF